MGGPSGPLRPRSLVLEECKQRHIDTFPQRIRIPRLRIRKRAMRNAYPAAISAVTSRNNSITYLFSPASQLGASPTPLQPSDPRDSTTSAQGCDEA
jgi:hypothetical protein